MASAPARPEIDNHTMKLIAGLIALALGPLTTLLAKEPLESISAAYWAGGVSQIVFVGFLFATAAFFLAYNGETTREMIASKLAAVSALGVALAPCECPGHVVLVTHLHGVSAAVMFLLLTYFCYVFYRRALAKHHARAKARAAIYAVCGVTMLVAIVVLAINNSTGGSLSRFDRWITFHGELTGLLAFGISWLTASRMIPGITREDERISILPAMR
jgi:hypothetical protein